MNRCAILIPTYRFDESSSAILLAACQLAGEKFQIIISDNSENSEKHIFLKNLQNNNPCINIYLHEKNIGAFENWKFLCDRSTCFEFVQWIADDDAINGNYIEPSLGLILNNDEASAAAGQLFVSQNNILFEQEKKDLESLDVLKNLENWFDYGSWNLLSYALIRRSIMMHWFNYINGHPLIGSFMDRLLTISIVVSGPVLRHNQGAYIWNSKNWAQDISRMASIEKHYEDTGAPRVLSLYFDLHFAIEATSFLICNISPVQDRTLGAQYGQIVWHRVIEHFRNKVNQNKEFYESTLIGFPQALEALYYFINFDSIPDENLIRKFPLIIKAFDEELAIKYVKHLDRIFTF